MTVTKKQVLPALHNSGKVKEPDLQDIGERNYTSTILKYANLSVRFPQLETDAKTVVPAINECRVIPNVGGSALLETEEGQTLETELGVPIECDGDEESGGIPLRSLQIKDPFSFLNSLTK